MSQSVDKSVLNRIKSHRKGWVFTPAHFKDLGSRTAVATALKRHKMGGVIRQLARGLYDYPRQDPEIGILAPGIDAIASALQVRDAVRLQPSGAYAANLLGLSSQVPMRVVFLTDGPSRKVQIGKQTIVLKRTTPRNMATAGRLSGLVIQALRHIGRKHVDTDVVKLLRQNLSDSDRKEMLKDIRYAPVWVAEIMREVAQGTGET